MKLPVLMKAQVELHRGHSLQEVAAHWPCRWLHKTHFVNALG
jgi:hypothetical protein